jgi:hypothetical protein
VDLTLPCPIIGGAWDASSCRVPARGLSGHCSGAIHLQRVALIAHPSRPLVNATPRVARLIHIVQDSEAGGL